MCRPPPAVCLSPQSRQGGCRGRQAGRHSSARVVENMFALRACVLCTGTTARCLYVCRVLRCPSPEVCENRVTLCASRRKTLPCVTCFMWTPTMAKRNAPRIIGKLTARTPSGAGGPSHIVRARRSAIIASDHQRMTGPLDCELVIRVT